MDKEEEALLWVDLEMSGLDFTKDRILELALVLTDWRLNPLSSSLHFSLHCEESVLSQMDAWCLSHHRESGVYQRSLLSQISVEEAEQKVLDLLQACPFSVFCLAGNSVHMDRLFLKKWMPQF